MKVLALLVVLAAISPGSCQPVAREVPVAVSWSDDAIRGMRRLLGLADDTAAVSILDDTAAGTGQTAAAIERAVLIWATRIDDVTTTLMSRITATPDDEAAIRSFVVGSTCEAIEASQEGPLTATDIREIVDEKRLTSRLPTIIGEAELLADLVTEIQEALEAGDLAASFPGIGQLLICARLGG